MDRTEPVRSTEAQQPAKPRYEPPRIVVYDESALLEMIGPAVACARWSTGTGRNEPPRPPAK